MPILPPSPNNATQGGSSNIGLTSLNTGVTSGATGWIPDYLGILKEAAQRAGVDMTTADGIRSGKTSIDYMNMSWSNYGLNLWTLDEQVMPLTQGKNTYILDPSTVDVLPNPAIRTFPGGGTVSQDIGISLVDYITYINIVNKQEQGKPNMCYVQRNTSPTVYFWLTPDGNGPYYFLYWRMRRMTNTGYQTNIPDMPYRFIDALTDGLAWRLALKKKEKDLNLIMMLKGIYDESFRTARNEDHSRADLHVAPLMGWGGSW